MWRALSLGLCLALPLTTAAGARTLKRPPHARGFQTRVGTYTIEPGQDLEVCEYRRLSNPQAIDVARFKLAMPEGAHHFAVWTYGGKITDDSKFPQGPVPSIGCTGVSPDDPFPQLLIPTQSPNVQLRFPKGVALHLDAHEQVWLNPHMRNFGTAPEVPDIRFNLYKAKKGSVKHYAEGLTFGNSTDIHIPAGGDQTLVVDWVAPIDITIIHLSTHQHRLGTYAKVEMLHPDGVGSDLLVETHNWQHPGSVWPQGGLRVEKGQKLRLTCTWHNTDDHPVRFGPKTTDEMCYGVGFMYRDSGDTTPVVGSGCIPSTKGLLCPVAPAAGG